MTPSVIKIKRMTYGDKKLPERAPSSAFWPGGGRPIAPSSRPQRWTWLQSLSQKTLCPNLVKRATFQPHAVKVLA
ncbi:hypothetical protein M5D96_006828 [Drosophila gunungcola]|uniref:Uncharacterized protein n=1 Tax=Drosophila gunungcola TaxID=103775 RepID=A0A9P9YPP0_9MUSC|nr:hypothetical protein M5D96_006828 [Drosophila gunungcola]